ncbi:hypothetical protein [Neorhizobium vignae]|uniref:hypothetical protein n=1 Tax=Neorhizobium vignae TaxID=690585 RepID=UPI0012678C25|nr:hypothetical protein [Neorhizobium vignae]
MATKEEVVASGLVGNNVALAAIQKLIELGHADVLAEVEKEALGSIESSIATSEAIDRDKTLEHAKDMVPKLFTVARAGSSFRSILQNSQR